MKLSKILIPVLALISFLIAESASAHDSRPLFVNITELDDTRAHVVVKPPPSLPKGQRPQISLGPGCTKIADNSGAPQSVDTTYYDCRNGLSNSVVSIKYPIFNPSISTLIRVKLNNGEAISQILSPKISEWTIPTKSSFASVASGYFQIGVDHIVAGLDHLLFLAGLIFIARTPRKILLTVTGFTVAHGIVIFLLSLDVISVSVVAVEAAIALSIVFVAAEISRNNKQSLTFRYPLFVSSGFGLIHGAGFASALAEYGLPQTERIAALVFFNFGVEFGQVAIISGVLMLVFLLSKVLNGYDINKRIDAPQNRLAFSYLLGIIASVWFFERALLS